jgi:hypothetical protein
MLVFFNCIDDPGYPTIQHAGLDKYHSVQFTDRDDGVIPSGCPILSLGYWVCPCCPGRGFIFTTWFAARIYVRGS